MLVFFILFFNQFIFSFIIGNLFGTFLNFLRNQLIWDGIILVIVLVLFEIVNFLIHNKSINPILAILLKNSQFGLLLGFFIDAYKVGS